MSETDDAAPPEVDAPAPTPDGGSGERSQRPHELELEMLELRPALEAVLMVADQPLDHLTLAQAVGHPPTDVERTLRELAAEYTEQGRGFELAGVAGGWRYVTREEFAPAVERFVVDGQQARLTQAALETLAVVAYRQPISRSRISAIRGVNVDGVARTLVTRGLIEEAGTDAESGAILYRTTSYFLERMGLDSVTDLPEIAPMLPDMQDLEDDEVPVVPSAADATGESSEDPIPQDDDVETSAETAADDDE